MDCVNIVARVSAFSSLQADRRVAVRWLILIGLWTVYYGNGSRHHELEICGWSLNERVAIDKSRFRVFAAGRSEAEGSV